MVNSRPSLCLSMIVRNEAPVIRRCLASVLPIIDYWAIVDTGSTDGTQGLITEYLEGVPGELVERPWVDFGHNRTEALSYARNYGRHVLVIDADEVLEISPDFDKDRSRPMPTLSSPITVASRTCEGRSCGTICRGGTTGFCMSMRSVIPRLTSGTRQGSGYSFVTTGPEVVTP